MMVAFVAGAKAPLITAALNRVNAEAVSLVLLVKVRTRLPLDVAMLVKFSADGGGAVPWRAIRKY